MRILLRAMPLALALHALPFAVQASDTLLAYAKKCDDAIGVTVPDFVCDAGTLVPTTNLNGNKCDRPNQLHEECDPGSKFQVLSESADAVVVAHCRKQGKPFDMFGDVAVIQHNKRNGATCFYQALGTLPGNVKAPSKGPSAYPWYPPSMTAAINCVRCHDNGPIVRSPYLAQLRDVPGAKDVLPGSHDPAFNRDQPYSFVGEDFAGWKAYSVEVRGNLCNSCHRMGVSNRTPLTREAGDGTALDFGIRATAASQINKNPHSASSPIWMPPGQITFDEVSLSAAQEIRNCALRLNESPLPNSDACRIRQFAGPYVPPSLEEYAAIWEKPPVAFVSLAGLTGPQFQTQLDKLSREGFRLTTVDGYEVAGTVFYAAIWEQRPSPVWATRYGMTGAEYQAAFESFASQGFRLVWVRGYNVGTSERYAAIWEQSPGPAYVARFGLTPAQFQETFDTLVAQGFRLKVQSGYTVRGEVRFAAIFEQSNGVPWVARYGINSAQFQAEFDKNLAQGFRLAHVSGYRVNGTAFYAAIWDKEPRQGLVARFGMSAQTYQAEFDRYAREGYKLKLVDAY